MDDALVLSAAALGLLAWGLPKAHRRLQLSRAKHRSLAGHARLAQRVAALVPGYAYDEADFFAAAPASSGWRRCSSSASRRASR